jgi:hypothetical protein
MEIHLHGKRGSPGLEDRLRALSANNPLSLVIEEKRERDKGPSHLTNRFETFLANFVVANFQPNIVCRGRIFT